MDTGSTMNHMSLELARKNNIQAIKRKTPVRIEQFDGSISESTHYVEMQIRIHKWNGKVRFELVPGLSEEMVMGNLWMAQEDIQFDWKKRTVKIPEKAKINVKYAKATEFIKVLAQEGSNRMGIITLKPKVRTEPEIPYVVRAFKAISAKYKKDRQSRTVTDSLRQDQEEQVKALMAHVLPEGETTNKKLIPPEFHDYLSVFSKEDADKLPDRRPFDHKIPLYEGEVPPFSSIYGMSKLELDALKDSLDEGIAKGHLRPSQSPAAAPILFVKKKDGSLRLCVDYRGLNKITIKNRNPLPLIHEMLDRLSTAKFYTTIDLRNAYNQIRIAEGDEWKTAFRTKYGLFEWLVMPFGLTNAPATFQHMMNHTFYDMLDKFVVAYLDDILIFSDTKEEHEEHVKRVLQRLQENKLYAKAEKCEFYKEEVEFLGYLVSKEGIRMDPAKIQSVVEWPTPKNIKEVRGFLGFTNFYRHFIKNYSKVVAPLTDLTKTTRQFEWTEKAEKAFEDIKSAFAKGDIIRHFQPGAPITIETDSSDFAIGAILSQLFDGKLQPIAFFSRKLNPAEMNYEIHDKELLAIVAALKAWRRYVEGTEEPVRIITDHQPLTYFHSKRMLSRRQARWNEVISEINYRIEYRTGKKSTKPDALSRRPDFEPTEEDRQHNVTQILSARTRSTTVSDSHQHHDRNHVDETSSSIPTLRGLDTEQFTNIVREAQRNDPEISDMMVTGPLSRENTERGYGRGDNGLLYVDDKVYLPTGNIRLAVVQEYHDQPYVGHLGQARTLDLVTRDFQGKDLANYVRDYVATCDKCARHKPRRHAPYGMLKPLPIPNTPWESISVDFIDQLPTSEGYDSIIVVVDRRTKLAHFEPTTTELTTEQMIQLFTKMVFSKHGLPREIVSDRGNKFVSRLWRDYLQGLGVSRRLSTTAHPQTDGQTERVNQWLDEYLRMYVNHQQDDWSEKLPLAEFAYNNGRHSSTTVSPFYATYGYHPRFNVLVPNTGKAQEHLNELQRVTERIGDFIRQGQEKQAKYYNKRRKEAPHFNIGDLVWLSTKNFRIKGRSKKLTAKWVGPYPITEVISDHAYRLRLPRHMRINNSFNVSLLEPYNPNSIPQRVPEPPPPVEVEGEEEFEIEKILDSRNRRGKLQYLVHWLGYGDNEDTWEPASNLEHASALVDSPHARYPGRPGPAM